MPSIGAPTLKAKGTTNSEKLSFSKSEREISLRMRKSKKLYPKKPNGKEEERGATFKFPRQGKRPVSLLTYRAT